MKRLPRITDATQSVLDALFEAGPDGERWGYELMEETGLKSGSLYPILSRLERHQLIAARWGDTDDDAPNGPRRRYYKLTTSGALALHEAEQVKLEPSVLAAWGFGTVAP